MYEAVNGKIIDVYADEPIFVRYDAQSYDIYGSITADGMTFTADGAALGRIVLDNRHQFFVNARERCVTAGENGEVTFALGSGFYADRPQSGFFAAFYDADGRLMSVKAPVSAALNKNLRAVTLRTALPEGCVRCALLCWDGLVPLTEVFEYDCRSGQTEG